MAMLLSLLSCVDEHRQEIPYCYSIIRNHSIHPTTVVQDCIQKSLHNIR